MGIADLHSECKAKLNLQNELKTITKKLSALPAESTSENEAANNAKIKELHSQIDKLKCDKYKLLMQIHEQNAVPDLDEQNLIVSGLSIAQQQKVQKFVTNLRKKSLLPTAVRSDDEMSECDNDLTL